MSIEILTVAMSKTIYFIRRQQAKYKKLKMNWGQAGLNKNRGDFT